MTIPLKWQSGDRCEIKGVLGVVESVWLKGQWIVARLENGRRLGCPSRMVQMVPMPEERTHGE